MNVVNKPFVSVKLSKLILTALSIILIMTGTSGAALYVADATTNSVVLYWTAPGDDGNTGSASQYDIRYSTVPITAATWDLAVQIDNEPLPLPAGSAESFTIDNLDYNTTYFFAIKAADEVPNWSALSNVVTITTPNESTAPANIADLSSSAQTMTSITLNWTAPGDDGTTGTAATYEIRFSSSPITDQNWNLASQVTYTDAPLPAGSAESVTINGLAENTTYYFAIKTADEVPNWSGLSNVLSVKTAADVTPPAAIDDLQASSGTNNGELTLTWSAPGDDGGIGLASQYLIRYSTSRINNSNWNDPIDQTTNFAVDPITPGDPGTLEAYTITHLIPGTEYFVAIKTVDDAGNESRISNISAAPALLDLSLGTDDDQLALLPDDYTLSQNYPNPFNPSTEIQFSLPERANVNLDIYNTLGQKIATLVNKNLDAGLHITSWDGTTDNGETVTSGVYFYRLTANQFSDTKKMVMMK